MIPNPIRKVLSTLRSRDVRFLLMGGQACVFYGGAEFSRDTDIVVLLDTVNLQRLDLALKDLGAERIAVPPFEMDYLRRGHAVHFRCGAPEALGIRLDVMAVLRGMDPFPELWKRRTTVAVDEGWTVDLLSLPDLVRAKKTQRDKDWPMLRRLIEADYAVNRDSENQEKVRFWLLESRTPRMLLELAARFPDLARRLSKERPLLETAMGNDSEVMEERLSEEEAQERRQDRIFWEPLVRELEALRHERLRREKP